MRPMRFDYDTFARDHWQKKPAVFRQAFDVPFATEGEMFQHFITVTRLKEKNRGGLPKVWLYTEEGSIATDLQPFLPTEADADFARWSQRVTDMLRGRRFTFVMNDWNTVSPVLWDRVRTFSRELHKALGQPMIDRIDIAAFVGNTTKTGFGVHDDGSEGLAFIVKGTKKMRVWPHTHVNAAGVPITSLRNSLRYEEHLEGSTLLEGGSGDVLFWPQSYWHCAEASGEELVCTINIGIETRRDGFALPKLLTAEVERLLRAHLLAPGGLRPRAEPGDLDDADRAIREKIQSVSEELRRVLEGGVLRDRVLQKYMELETAGGIEDHPPLPDEPTLDDGARVRGRRGDVAWAPSASTPDTLLVAVNGRSIELPDHPRVRQLLDWVDSGREGELGALLRDIAGDELEVEDVRQLVASLAALRAVEPG